MKQKKDFQMGMVLHRASFDCAMEKIGLVFCIRENHLLTMNYQFKKPTASYHILKLLNCSKVVKQILQFNSFVT